jgi:uncharacterized damage-inducible protein DinB
MKKLLLLLPAVFFLSFSRTGSTLSKAERDYAVKYMNETKETLMRGVKGLSEAQLNFKAAPDRWSIAQCLEHIAISENALIGFMQSTSLKQAADSSKKAEIKVSDEDILKKITDRSRKATAPDFLQPSGKFKTSEEALNTFVEQRNKNIEYIKSTNDDLRNHFMQHPALGTIDDYQWILVIAAHSRRHTLQIEEVKSDPNFPKN